MAWVEKDRSDHLISTPVVTKVLQLMRGKPLYRTGTSLQVVLHQASMEQVPYPSLLFLNVGVLDLVF